MEMKQTLRPSTTFAREAATWQIGARAAAILWWLPLLGSVALVAVFAAHRPLFDFLLREDSVIEWLSAAAFAAIAALAVVCAHRLRKRALIVQSLAYACLAVVAFIASGEEISWGQRVLGIETPEAVREENLQEELTLHNVSFIFPLYVVGMVLVGLYGSLGSWLVYRVFSLRSSLNARLFVPPLFLSSAFLLLVLYRGARLIAPSVRFGEWCEFCVAAAAAVFVLLNARGLAPEARVIRPGATRSDDALNVHGTQPTVGTVGSPESGSR
jgi:hypothetical protein